MNITYKRVKDKIVICKDGVYFSLTRLQAKEVKSILIQIGLEAKDWEIKDA